MISRLQLASEKQGMVTLYISLPKGGEKMVVYYCSYGRAVAKIVCAEA